ncbi:hypothetical protein COV42_01810 [Candidatus Campbellbacteria bacterium CG11_big_fil_rev_8_21_14_0_20_44_21]|uniref:Uncharacterized protein n=1 Tax=Candidatus Campbellbacteria bacterium CG22_combo_CG10-13_8_21_14_all_43_18 TaxID=1974530 RepID=A0A2H0DX64_9BACT|nr:MAG: hypothetical protein COW82_01305 [Candidatus Campbellbacteria bacterium CG22_combo_CG10-13_8_21_14_all_43_18]PIR24244.1 MAG: hypothetical protein COV42_01810 [Candidatus Campbellbacteria bacterium CG11_big_fil_rev_8_21_14_0_20_44_21]
MNLAFLNGRDAETLRHLARPAKGGTLSEPSVPNILRHGELLFSDPSRSLPAILHFVRGAGNRTRAT